jgi:hypothetical protein
MGKLREFSLQELAEATGGFHPIGVIGEGGFGQVYRAMISLTPVAIKVGAARWCRHTRMCCCQPCAPFPIIRWRCTEYRS